MALPISVRRSNSLGKKVLMAAPHSEQRIMPIFLSVPFASVSSQANELCLQCSVIQRLL
jgi:hypothetical protein